MVEGVAENGEQIVTYEVLGTSETFVQVVKDDKNHESYEIDHKLEKQLARDLKKNTKLADLKIKLDAEKLKPIEDYRAKRAARIEAKIREREAAQIEAEKVVKVDDAVIVEEPIK